MSDLFGGLLGALGAFAGGGTPLALGQQRAVYDPQRMRNLQQELLEAIYAQGPVTPLHSAMRRESHALGNQIMRDALGAAADQVLRPTSGPGQTSLAAMRKQLDARADAYKVLGIPEEAGDVKREQNRQAVRDARTGRYTRDTFQPPARPLPEDIFERENLWITEGTTETFSEWLERRDPETRGRMHG